MIKYSIPYLVFFIATLLLSIPLCVKGYGKGVNLCVNKSDVMFRHISVAYLFLIFLGLRGYIYTDWVNYNKAFDLFPTLGGLDSFDFDSLQWEKGFVLYVIILKSICNSYVFFQFVSCLIDFIILCFFFKRYIPNHIIFGFVFFIVFDGMGMEINLMRNQKGIILFLLSIPYITEKKLGKFVLLNLVGCTFHISSILYLPLYFVLVKKNNGKLVLFLFILGNFFFLFQIKWITIILTIFSDFLPSRLGSLVRYYLNNESMSASYGISIGYIERLVSFVWVYIFFIRKRDIDKRLLPFVNSFIIYSFVFLYCSEMFIILQRIPILFACGYWVLYPLSYDILRKEYKIIFIFFLLIYSVLKIGIGNSKIVCAYDSFLIPKYSYEMRLYNLKQYLKNN